VFVSGPEGRCRNLSSPWSEAGDSIAVLRDVRGEQIHLWGIDCPDKNQDFGTKAKHATSILVLAKVMEVESVTTDRYGRTVAPVRVGDTLVKEELIRQEACLGVHPML